MLNRLGEKNITRISISLTFVSSDRSSYSDAVQLDTFLLSQIFTQSIDAIDITSVTLSCFNSINAIESHDAN